MDLFRNNLVIGSVPNTVYSDLVTNYYPRLQGFYLYCNDECDRRNLMRLAALGFRACTDDSGLAFCCSCNSWNVPFCGLYAVNAAEWHFAKCWDRVKYKLISTDCFKDVDLYSESKYFYPYENIVSLQRLCENNIVCIDKEFLFCTLCGFQQFMSDLYELPICLECT